MSRLEIRTNPLHPTVEEVGEFELAANGSPTLVLTDQEDIKAVQRNSEFRAGLNDGAYDSGSTSTFQILDAGILVAQAEANRVLTKAHRFDLFRRRFADATARLADAASYIAADLFSFGLQEDDGSIWYLIDETVPTWALFRAATTTTGADLCITRLISVNTSVGSGITCLGRDTVIADGIELLIDDTGEFLVL